MSQSENPAGLIHAAEFRLCGVARSIALINATIPSIRSVLFFLEGFQLSAASVSMETLEAIQRSTGLRRNTRSIVTERPLKRIPAFSEISWELRWMSARGRGTPVLLSTAGVAAERT